MNNLRSENLEKSDFSEPRFDTETYQKMSGIENYLKTIHINVYKRGEHPETTSYMELYFFKAATFPKTD